MKTLGNSREPGDHGLETRFRALAWRVSCLAMALPACTALLDGTFEPTAEDAAVDVGDLPDTDTAPDAGGEPVLWKRVAAGTSHTCGLRTDGSLWCWGNYGSGQLGDGRVGDGSALHPQPTPTRVLAAEGDEADPWQDWVDVVAGEFHTCGRREDGSLWCWGSNFYGQLGNGDSRSLSPQPVRVVADEDGDDDPWNDWVEVTAGGTHTCGRRDDGTLWCWGWREDGRLGDGTDEGERETPSRVLGENQIPGQLGWDDWVQVSAGGSHTCGRLLDGTAWCWGRGSFGQLGDGEDGNEHHRTTPGQVRRAEEEDEFGGWDDWTTLVAASSHTCGQRADGTLWCWGSREDGKLGDGDASENRRSTPSEVTWSDGAPGEGDPLRSLALGMSHTCGILGDGTLWCWGSGTDGNLGDGFAADRSTPVRVLQADEDPGGAWWDDWVQVTAGRGHTCGLREDGTLWCWGRGETGQRGDGTSGDTSSERVTPVQVLDPPSDG